MYWKNWLQRFLSRILLAKRSVNQLNMFGEWIIKGILFIVLGMLDLLGWKRAGKWLDKIVGEGDKEEKPVI
jgi:hypothetical protein